MYDMYSRSTVMDTCFEWMNLILNFIGSKNIITRFASAHEKKIILKRKKDHENGVTRSGDTWSPRASGASLQNGIIVKRFRDSYYV